MSKFWEQYKDPRWQKRRLERMELSGFKCQNCADSTKTLHVHHKIYRRDKAPWDYELDELECLCEDCHLIRHKLKDRMNDALVSLTLDDYHELLGYAEALALMRNCDGDARIKPITDVHAAGVSAAFAWHETAEILELMLFSSESFAGGASLDALLDLRGKRRDKAIGN